MSRGIALSRSGNHSKSSTGMGSCPRSKDEPDTDRGARCSDVARVSLMKKQSWLWMKFEGAQAGHGGAGGAQMMTAQAMGRIQKLWCQLVMNWLVEMLN